jgi:hypothetical protein
MPATRAGQGRGADDMTYRRQRALDLENVLRDALRVLARLQWPVNVRGE